MRSSDAGRVHSLQSQLAFAAPVGRLGTFSAVSSSRPGMLQASKVATAGQRVALRGGAGRDMSSSPTMVPPPLQELKVAPRAIPHASDICLLRARVTRLPEGS